MCVCLYIVTDIYKEMGGACSVWWRGEVYTGFWWGNLR